MATNKRSGKTGKVTVDANDVPVENWTFNGDSDTDETTDTDDAGWKSRISSVKGATGGFTGVWDVTKIPFAATPGIDIGKEVALELYIGDPSADGHKIELTAIIKTCEMTSNIKTAVRYTCTYESTGSITLPTGA